MDERRATLRELAAAHGFHVLGVSSARPVRDDLERLTAWCEAGHGAELHYMTRNPPERADPRTLWKTVRTVVSVAVDYYVPQPAFESEGRFGRVARYAWGRDYHEVALPRLRALASALSEAFGGGGRAACDHSPILERAFAVRAELGFFGKNTCLLRPRHGSWFFLGEVLLDAELSPFEEHPVTDHCGTCTSCLDACPTDAFPAPFVLDSRRCISYLTIEHKGVIPRDLRDALGAWVFGCDVCQEVCPFNRFAPVAAWPELHPAQGVGPRLDLLEVLAIPDETAFREFFLGTPLLRPGRAGLLRNVITAARNVGCQGAVPLLEPLLARGEDAIVRAHALWALRALDPDRFSHHAARLEDRERDPLVRAEL